ncbi:hypothetical protein DSECCO2_563630 [anaerobic digester metagenome]
MLDDYVIQPSLQSVGLSASQGAPEGAVSLNADDPYTERSIVTTVVARAEDPDLDDIRCPPGNSGDQKIIAGGKGGAGCPGSDGGNPELDGGCGVYGIGEVSLIPRCGDGMDRIIARVKGPIEIGGIPTVGPGLIGLNIHSREGRRGAVHHRRGRVFKPDTAGVEARTGQEEVGDVTICIGTGEGDLLADVVGAGARCGHGDGTLLNPHHNVAG